LFTVNGTKCVGRGPQQPIEVAADYVTYADDGYLVYRILRAFTM